MTFVLAILFIMFVLGPIARSVGAAIEKTGEKRAIKPSPLEVEELRAVSEQVSLLAERLDRLSEEQTFLLRLMEEDPKRLERPGAVVPTVREERSR